MRTPIISNNLNIFLSFMKNQLFSFKVLVNKRLSNFFSGFKISITRFFFVGEVVEDILPNSKRVFLPGEKPKTPKLQITHEINAEQIGCGDKFYNALSVKVTGTEFVKLYCNRVVLTWGIYDWRTGCA